MSAFGGEADITLQGRDFRLWHKTDLRECPSNVCFRREADIPPKGRDFRLWADIGSQRLSPLTPLKC